MACSGQIQIFLYDIEGSGTLSRGGNYPAVNLRVAGNRQGNIYVIGGASAASEATLSSCPLRFAVYVGIIVRATNP